MKLCHLFFLLRLHAHFIKKANKLFNMINVAALHTKQAFTLLMCYFVYKVITNKVFKKVTCQLLGWWIPFPQWKHASAEASNFLSCTPPKLQCRDCLVINRASTVPSLCIRLCTREGESKWNGGGGFPSKAADYRPSFHYLQSLLQLHLADQERGFPEASFQQPKKKEKKQGQFYNLGLIWDAVPLMFNHCKLAEPASHCYETVVCCRFIELGGNCNTFL